MSFEERTAFRNRGGYCEASAQFVEELATACQWKLENAPSYMTEKLLWDQLDDDTTVSGQADKKRETLRFDYETNLKMHAHQLKLKLKYTDGMFQTGSLGIQFNHDGTVEQIETGSQADELLIGLSRGDYLVQIGQKTKAINTTGMTWNEMEKVLDTFTRPVYLKFEQHQKWKRNASNGLPMINFKKLEATFDKFESKDQPGTFGVTELSQLWKRIHTMAIKSRGLYEEYNVFDSSTWATQLIDAHDENNSGRLDKQEFVNWISKDSDKSKEQREADKARGGYHPADVQIVEDLAYGLAVHITKGPMSQRATARTIIVKEKKVANKVDFGDETNHAGETLKVDVKEKGPIGIFFNHEHEIEKLAANSQAGKVKGLSKGDWLVKINDIDVREKTLHQVQTILRDVKRPLTLEFERHGNWVRNKR